MSQKLSKIIAYLASLPKSIYVNFACLPASQARKLPILVSWRTRILAVHKGTITLSCPAKFGLATFGFGGTEYIQGHGKNILALEPGSSLEIGGATRIGQGFSMHNEGKITIGKDFSANKNFRLFCTDKVTIGKDVLIGWDVSVNEAKGHTVICEGKTAPKSLGINIGNHVWVASDSAILEKTQISNHSVVATRSLVNKPFTEEYVLLAGTPAVIKQRNIDWKS